MEELTDREWLEHNGFEGFVTVDGLRASSLEAVPEAPGVYAVLGKSDAAPRFLRTNPSGRFKGKDATVSRDMLRRAWVEGSRVLYLGKAGGSGSTVTLRRRLRQYLDFGAGRPVAHWGGRLVWQMTDSDGLLVCWKVTRAAAARGVERELLQAFRNEHGKLPFANLRG